MESIKAIVLDFGNVIINIDPELTVKQMSVLSGKSHEAVKKLLQESELFRRYETGLFNDEDFREIVRQTLGFPFSDREVDHAWNALLLDVPPERISLLLDLRAKYPLYLLSNTNHIHIAKCNTYFREHFGIASVDTLFDKAFLSYEMGMWKPDKAIYLEVLSEIGVEPSEMLFVDDNLDNITAAKKLGIQAIHLTPDTDLVELFKKLNL